MNVCLWMFRSAHIITVVVFMSSACVHEHTSITVDRCFQWVLRRWPGTLPLSRLSPLSTNCRLTAPTPWCGLFVGTQARLNPEAQSQTWPPHTARQMGERLCKDVTILLWSDTEKQTLLHYFFPLKSKQHITYTIYIYYLFKVFKIFKPFLKSCC